MADWFSNLNALLQALLAAGAAWLATALGAAAVFVFPDLDRRVFDAMLGFAAGVLIATSYWSLLAPAIAMAGATSLPGWVPAVIGFLLGGAFLWGVDRTLPHLHPSLATPKAEGLRTGWQRSVLLTLAVTLNNVPEGLAIGVAYGALASGVSTASLAGAAALTLGIAIQDVPEGMMLAVLLRREGFSSSRGFWYGQLSGILEPVAAVLAAAAVLFARPILPYALAFAAGAIIYVVVEELIPEAQRGADTHIATFGAMLGFALMMVLQVALS